MANKLPQLIKSMTGKHKVKYGCPKCGETLVNPLSQAGTQDTCPKCNQLFIVPGKNFADKLMAEAEAKKQQLKTEASEKQKQKIETTGTIHEADVRQKDLVHYETAASLAGERARRKNQNWSNGELIASDENIKGIASIVGLLGIVCPLLLMIGFRIGFRFQNDNAIGASANMLELGVLIFSGWGCCCLAVAIHIYVKLRQLARK